MSSSNSVTVQILDKEYSIICPPEERSNLVSAARYLDGKMREIRSSGKVIGADRIAVMAALNITHDLLHKEERPDIRPAVRPVSKCATCSIVSIWCSPTSRAPARADSTGGLRYTRGTPWGACQLTMSRSRFALPWKLHVGLVCMSARRKALKSTASSTLNFRVQGLS